MSTIECLLWCKWSSAKVWFYKYFAIQFSI